MIRSTPADAVPRDVKSPGAPVPFGKGGRGVVALLIAGDLVEDWLDPLGVSLEAFCGQMMGSWLFSYVQALTVAGVRCILICVSSRIRKPLRLTHAPTGVEIRLLPAPRLYRWLRQQVPSPRASAGTGRAKRRHLWLQPLSHVKMRLLTVVLDHCSTPFWRVAGTLRGDRCRVLFVQEYETARFDVCALLGRAIGVSVFGTFTAAYRQPAWRRPLRRLALNACEGLAVCARVEAERVVTDYGFPTAKLRTIHYPLDFTVWQPVPRSEARSSCEIRATAEVVMYHGSIDIHFKGLDVLLAAWDRLCRERPGRDFQLVILGTGRDAPRLAEMIADNRVPGVRWRNEWLHDRQLLRRYLSSADVYAFPSRDDAFGIALTEAMACGLPVVAANVRGVQDILEGGEAAGGLLVPPGDSDALARALGRLLDDKSLALELGTRARRRVEEQFRMEPIGADLRSFLLGRGAVAAGPGGTDCG